MRSSKIGTLSAFMALALSLKPGGIPRTPSTTKSGRRMVHAKGAHETHGMRPALTPEQRNWNAQVEAKRKQAKRKL